MTRPEGISEEAWAAAEKPAHRIYLDIEAAQHWDIRPTVARAIDAARAEGKAQGVAEERERCAEVAEEHAVRENLLPLCSAEMNAGAQRGMEECREEIADAIRKGSDPGGEQ